VTGGLDIGVYGARAIPSTYSGYETFLATLLPQLAARGHRVTMYCRATEGVETGPYLGVERVWLPAVPGKQFNTLSHGLLAAMRARAARHDVCLVVNVANAPGCALQRWTGQPVVLNTDGQEWLRGKWGRLGRAWFRSSARIAHRAATALVSDCVAMADVYEQEFGARTTVIPYCVPDRGLRRGTGVLDDFGLEHRGYYVVAGRLNPENNVDRVAESYARSDRPEPLVVLGVANYDSPVAANLRALAARDERIRLGGHLHDRDRFLELLGAAKAYVHAHSVGGMNPSLVEAMRAGAYVVALDTPFNREVVGEHGRYFLLDHLPERLSRDARRAPAEMQMYRDATQQRALERFAIDGVVDAYESLLVAAAGARRRDVVVLDTPWRRDDVVSAPVAVDAPRRSA
jgi:glycosyltransferase involved in cell wall biosynthesis